MRRSGDMVPRDVARALRRNECPTCRSSLSRPFSGKLVWYSISFNILNQLMPFQGSEMYCLLTFPSYSWWKGAKREYYAKGRDRKLLVRGKHARKWDCHYYITSHLLTRSHQSPCQDPPVVIWSEELIHGSTSLRGFETGNEGNDEFYRQYNLWPKWCDTASRY